MAVVGVVEGVGKIKGDWTPGRWIKVTEYSAAKTATINVSIGYEGEKKGQTFITLTPEQAAEHLDNIEDALEACGYDG